MALKPNETNPPVTRSHARQNAQQVGGSRSIVDQHQLPILINLRKHRIHSLAEPRNRSVEYRRKYADERLRNETARLNAHPLQLLRTRAMMLKPLLVFALCNRVPERRLLLVKLSPNCSLPVFSKADMERATPGQSCVRGTCATCVSLPSGTSAHVGIVSASVIFLPAPRYGCALPPIRGCGFQAFAPKPPVPCSFCCTTLC